MGKKQRITPSTPALPKADELSLYRANLLTPLLEQLVVANRLGSLTEARQNQDKIKFSGLYKLESYVSELKGALEALPCVNLTAKPGDVVAGLQIHHPQGTDAGSKTITAAIAPPSAVDTCGSYLHGTTVESNCNIDVNVTLPDGFITEKDYQNYGYFDKRALYVAATALHLRHYSTLKFASLYITHEPNDQNKPIIVIRPSADVDVGEKGQNEDNFVLNRPPSSLFKKFIIILHFVPPINTIALRKLAPNRNNVKMIEQQRWVDYSKDYNHQNQKIAMSPLSEAITIPNMAPTPDYNHSILLDMLSTSQACTYATLLNESSLIQSVVVIAKIWLKLRGLYIEGITTEFTNPMDDQCDTVSKQLTLEYNQFLTQVEQGVGVVEEKVEKKGKKGTSTATSATPPTNDLSTTFTSLLRQSKIHYTYRQHYTNHTYGLTGSQITHIIVNLFLSRKLSTHNSLQHCMDALFRFFILHYPDNKDAPSSHTFLPNQLTTLNPDHQTSLITSPLALPPDYDQGVTLGVLQQAQEDYKGLYDQIPPSTLFHSFDIIMLDCNGIYNILYNISTSTWNQLQGHSLYSLKAVYGNNMGSLLSHDVTPELLNGNFASTLRHSHLGPMPDEDVFSSLYMTKIADFGQLAQIAAQVQQNVANGAPANEGILDFDHYLAQFQALYLAQIKQLCDNNQFTGELKIALPHQIDGDNDEDDDEEEKDEKYVASIQDQIIFLLQTHPLFNQDSSLLNYDGVYDVTLPISYTPYYPILNVMLSSQRLGKKKISDEFLHQEMLTKVSFATTKCSLPLFVTKFSPTAKKIPSVTNNISTNQLTTTFGSPQTPLQLQTDGDIVSYIPHPHLPTTALWVNINARINNIISHSFTNRVYALSVQPRLNTTHTSFIWRIQVKLDPVESSRGLDKGPHAEQQVKCKEWRSWWGNNKSELRRFQDGSIMEVLVWNHSISPYPLPNEQIPFIIAQYILPLHVFTSSVNNDVNSIHSNQCVVSTTTHPLGALLQSKTDQHLIDMYSGLNSADIVQDAANVNPYQGNDLRSISRLVTTSCPIPNTLLKSFTSLSTMLREMHQFPLGIENIECTSAAMRGTTPFYPKQHFFDVSNPPTPNQVNHFFTQLQENPCYSGDPQSVGNNDIFEPINVVLTLGNSNKWPQNDLLAISRIKTAFYLKLASVIRTEYSTGDVNQNHKMSFNEAQQKVLEKNRKKNKKDGNNANSHVVSGSVQAAKNAARDEDENLNNPSDIGPIYSQVTPYFIDIYIQGYVYRCRIAHSHEVSLFRQQTASDSTTIAPIVLGDGIFRTFEKEYLYRPKHNAILKNLLTNFPMLATTTQLLYRWFQAHYVSRHVTIELCELIVASVFVQSAPFFIPNSLPAAFSRVIHRLATFPFDSKPIIIPDFDFSMSQDAENKLTQLKFKKLNSTKGAIGGLSQQISIICANHQTTMSYYHQEYQIDINIDQLPTIYANFNRRTADSSRSMIYIVTPYDRESRAWTTRPMTNFIYKDHLQTLLSQLESKDNMDERTANRIINMINMGKNNAKDLEEEMMGSDDDNDDDDGKFVTLHQAEELNQEDMKNSYRNYYSSLIDRGENPAMVQNTIGLVSSLSLHDFIQLQSISRSALASFTTLFFTNTNTLSTTPLTLRQVIPPQRQVGYNKELWPLKAPTQWSFKHWLALFKPNLAKFDAFIMLTPNSLTIDQIKRSIWLFKSKSGEDDEEFLHFFARMNDQSEELNNQFEKEQLRKQNNGKKVKKDYKLPPDLVKKLKEEEETAKLMELQAVDKRSGNGAAESVHNTINFKLFAGKNYIESYLSELRATFGQYASFYTDPNGSRLIAVKFHPFFLQNQNQVSLGMIREKIMKDVLKQKTKIASSPLNPNYPTPHIQHPVQSDLHLVGLKVAGAGNNAPGASQKGMKLKPDLEDLVNQMAQIGTGIVQKVFIGYDEFTDHIYF